MVANFLDAFKIKIVNLIKKYQIHIFFRGKRTQVETAETGKETSVPGARCPKCKFPVCDEVCKLTVKSFFLLKLKC